MMASTAWWIALVGSAIATYASRAFFLVPEGTRPPARLEPALRLVGPAVLAALTIPAILRAPGTGTLDASRVLAGAVAFAVAYRTKSIFGTILVGFTVLFGVDALRGLM